MSRAIGLAMFIRLFRRWSAARSTAANPLPHMLDALHPFAVAPELAVASASLFELVEAHLGRQLVPECCCSSAMSVDEQALVGVLRHAPEAGQPRATPAVPHGLPGAICWAAFAVRRALHGSFGPAFDVRGVEEISRPARCPFARPAERGERGRAPALQ